MKKRNRNPDYYMPRMLKQLWLETGRVFMAVYRGGATLVRRRSNARVTFSDLLDKVPSGLEVIVPLIMGNDVYGAGCDEELEEAIRDFSAQLLAKGKQSYVVFGGSGATCRLRMRTAPTCLGSCQCLPSARWYGDR